jgi:hypothetical protein
MLWSAIAFGIIAFTFFRRAMKAAAEAQLETDPELRAALARSAANQRVVASVVAGFCVLILAFMLSLMAYPDAVVRFVDPFFRMIFGR